MDRFVRWLTTQTFTFQSIITGALQVGQTISSATAGWIFKGDGTAEIPALSISGTEVIGTTAGRTGFSNLVGFGGNTDDELTIATGAITVTQSFHRVDTESDASLDDLATINTVDGAKKGDIVFLRTVSSARDVRLIESGNIDIDSGSTLTLDQNVDLVMLVYNGTNWKVMANAGGTIA